MRILNTIWFDIVEPPSRSYIWIKPVGFMSYITYIYSVNGWEIIATSTSVTRVTSAEYEALDKDPSTLYVVIDEGSSSGNVYLGETMVGSGAEHIVLTEEEFAALETVDPSKIYMTYEDDEEEEPEELM